MKNIQHTRYITILRGAFLALCCIIHYNVQGQEIVGPSSVNVGDVITYTYTAETQLTSIKWSCTNGTVPPLGQATGLTYSIAVTWTTTGLGSVTFTRTINGSPVILATKQVTVCTALKTPQPEKVMNCGSENVTLVATPGIDANSVRWYGTPSSYQPLATGTTHSVYLSGPASYYISSLNTSTGCESKRIVYSVSPSAKPYDVLVQNNSICGPGDLTLHAGTLEKVVRWYDAPEGGTLIASEVVDDASAYLDLQLTATKTLYVATYNPNTRCELSPRRVQTAAVVDPPPPPSSIEGNVRFGPGEFTLSADQLPTDRTFAWSFSPSGPTSFTGNPYKTPAVSATTINYAFVKSVRSGCISSSIPVNVEVIPTPIIIATSSFIAKGAPVTLTSSLPFDRYEWRNQTGSIISTGKDLTTSETGTYTLTVYSKGLSYATQPFSLQRPFDNLDMNYIITDIFQNTREKDGITDFTNLSLETATQDVQYYDGFARPIQKVTTQGSPTRKDIIEIQEYDILGRPYRQYLPVTVNENSGRYKTGLTTPAGGYAGSAASFYATPGDNVADDAKPFSEITYLHDPLDRILKQGAPGTNWQPDTTKSYASTDKTIKKGYTLADAGEVLRWTFSCPTTSFPFGQINAGSSAVYYGTNQIYKHKTKDEHGNETIEYVDTEGKILLRRVQVNSGSVATDDSNYASTYYIYDDFGNQVCVLPPEAVNRLTQQYFGGSITDANRENFLARWAFRYTYDGKRRITQKQLPGAASVYLVYDNRNRLVFTQPGNLRSAKQWLFTKYDASDRAVLTGIYTADSVLTQPKMQRRVNYFYSTLTSSGAWYESYVGTTTINVHGYNNKSYPQELDANNYLTATYYDNYDFTSSWIGDYQYHNDSLRQTVGAYTYSQPETENRLVENQITGKKVKALDGGITGGFTWLKTVLYYDRFYNALQAQADNYKGGIDRTSTLYDFTGRILNTKLSHTTYDVEWTGVSGAIVTGNKLIKTAATAYWTNSGAASTETLAAGQDGWVDVTASEANTYRMVGLSRTNPDLNYSRINYAIYFYGASLRIYEIKPPATTSVLIYTHPDNVKPGDVVRIERRNSVIRYKLNGTTIYTSVTPAPASLLVDASLYTINGTLTGVRSSFSKTETTISQRYIYDLAGRTTEVWHSVNNNPEVRIIHNTYNEIGQLVDKKIHSTDNNAGNAKQSIDYRYTIRGWLASLNDATLTPDGSEPKDYFGMEFGYNDPLIGVNDQPACNLSYNGNISAIKWSKNLGLGATSQNAYVYSYDALNRITGSSFKEKSSSWTAPGNNAFAETGLSYDLNGNIKTLTRNDGRASGTMDVLTYSYGLPNAESNKLVSVTDNGDDYKGFRDGTNTGDDYSYDANGNMLTDLNKGISTPITYNYLNLPEVISTGTNSLRNIYDATGIKLAQVATFGNVGKTTYYIGALQYENKALSSIQHDEGRVMLLDETDVFKADGSSLNGLTSLGSSSATLVKKKGNQDYVMVTSNGGTGQGVDINGTMSVSAGDRYRISVKGYYEGTNPASIYVKTNIGNVLLGTQSWGPALPAKAGSESWIEETVTIPTGGNQLQISAVWPTATSSDVFYLNEIRITRLNAADSPEYQYYLKDHLGNVRLTFTTKHEVDSATATMETAHASDESSGFLNYNEAVKLNSRLFDHTHIRTGSVADTTNFAILLRGEYGETREKYGLAKSLSVMPGDTVKMEVFAKYIALTDSSLANDVQNALTVIAGGPKAAGKFIDGGSAGSLGGSAFPFLGLLNHTDEPNESAPKAYLNWLVFDKEFSLINAGYQPVTTAAAENGSGLSEHERLAKDLLIEEPGYVYIYLSNENESPVDVFFDDFGVQHVKSPVIQMDDYYPFGLAFNSYSSENSTPQDFKYNGKEEQTELELGWLDYGARMYMPEIGRWGVQDPHADSYHMYSPYNYAVDNPINVIDPDGNDIYILTWFSKQNETGHAGIAIDNYKTQNKKDAQGNDILDANGNPVTEQIKDGTFTYFDLWPNDPVGDTELQDDVKADYSKGKKINSLSDLTGTDVTTGRSGNVSPEGRAADGVVKITTSFAQDENAKKEARKNITADKKYNACDNNCSTFAQRVLNAGLAPNQVDAGQNVRPSGALRLLYNDARVVAPNNLYNTVLGISGAIRIKGPTSVTAKPYLEYFGKTNRP